jgi:hypothetical protein
LENVIRLAIQKDAGIKAVLEFSPVTRKLDPADQVAKWREFFRKDPVPLDQIADNGHLRLFHRFEDRAAKMIKRRMELLLQQIPVTPWAEAVDFNEPQSLGRDCEVRIQCRAPQKIL